MAKTKAVARRRSRTIIKRVGSRARKTTIPLAIVAGMAPTIGHVWAYRSQGIEGMGAALSMRMTGYDPRGGGTWRLGELKAGLLPLAVGIFAHKVIGGRLGVNRMLANSGIPFIRI